MFWHFGIPLSLYQNKYQKIILGCSSPLSLYDYLRVEEGMIINGFKQVGIKEALTIELESQDPFYDLL